MGADVSKGCTSATESCTKKNKSKEKKHKKDTADDVAATLAEDQLRSQDGSGVQSGGPGVESLHLRPDAPTSMEATPGMPVSSSVDAGWPPGGPSGASPASTFAKQVSFTSPLASGSVQRTQTTQNGNSTDPSASVDWPPGGPPPPASLAKSAGYGSGTPASTVVAEAWPSGGRPPTASPVAEGAARWPAGSPLPPSKSTGSGGQSGSGKYASRNPSFNASSDRKNMPAPPPASGVVQPHLEPSATGFPARGNKGAEGAVRVRILQAYNLTNRDTGLFGDVSDPYVKARVGGETRRTPCIDNNLNPVWDSENDFVIPLDHSDGTLELEVMNSNIFKDTSLGRTSLGIGARNLPPGQWHRRRVPLSDGQDGELEFEVLFTPNPHEAQSIPRPVPQSSSSHPNGAQGGPGLGQSSPATPEEDRLEYQFGPRMYQPRSQALAWDGVRVLELTRRTWTAALCGRMMATNGADVMRVAFGQEALVARKKGATAGRPLRPGAARGDNDGRLAVDKSTASEIPRVLHAGKRLAPHHPEDPQEMALLRSELLLGCHVFLTDLPGDELDRLQLSPSTLRQQFPWMIVVHASTIGSLADIANRGVNDAGAFFSLSGLAEELGHFLGPTGFAAATSASALFGVASLAVMRRRCGSPGDRVEMSIFRAGRWCAALGALSGWAKAPQPDRRYSFGSVDSARDPATPYDVEGAACLMPDAAARHSAKLEPLHASWLERGPASQMPAVMSECPIFSELPLARASVIELSDEYHISAAAIGCLLADLGARVTKVERPQRPDPWKRSCPQLYQDLTARKTVQSVSYSQIGGIDEDGRPVQGQAALYRTLADTTILVTNLPAAALEAWGLETKRLQAMFPHLIIVQVSTWGCDEAAKQRELSCGRKGGQEMNAFWETSGLGRSAFNDKAMPPGLGELALAQHALAGIGVAMLRQQRTGGGQLVHVSRHKAGVYSRLISEIEPATPLCSPLLRMVDGRFMRLLGRGHKPHDAWMLLHAVGRRGSLWEKAGASVERVKAELEAYTWEDLKRHQDELLACARAWTFDDLAKAFREKGIDWFVEEMRPTDAEALHRQRAEQAELVRQRHQDAVERALTLAEQTSQLKQNADEAKESAQAQLEEQLQDQQERRQRMEMLREQFSRNVPPDLFVTIDGAEGLKSETTGMAINTYCVCEVLRKPHSRLQTPLQSGTHPEWSFTGQVDEYALGDTLIFAVFNKVEDLPVDQAAALKTVEHSTVCYVQVHAAYSLQNTDTGIMGDVSDPYVTCKVGEVIQKTSTIDNNLNPVWQENNQFSFTVQDPEADRYVELEVMNSNVMRDDSLGNTKLDLRSVEPGQWRHFRVPLEDGKGAEIEFDVFLKPAEPCKPHDHTDELLGRVDMEMSRFYPKGFEGSLQLCLANQPTGASLHIYVEVEPQGQSSAPSRRASSPRATRSTSTLPAIQRGDSIRSMASHKTVLPPGLRSQRRLPTGQEDQQLEPMASKSSVGMQSMAAGMATATREAEMSVLRIRVNGATNLTNRDTGLFGDVSDPYVIVRAGNSEQKTPTIDNDLNPVWKNDNVFNFEVTADQNKVELEVMNSNTFRDSSLGSCEFDLRSIQHGIWVRRNEKLVGGLKGELSFDVFFKPTQYRKSAQDLSSVLHLRINNARNLLNKDTGVLGDVSDPYVVIKVGELQQRTPTIDNNLNPDWREGNQFTFQVSEEDVTIDLEVMNSNIIRDDSLGKAKIQIGRLKVGEWCRLVEKLENGAGATVELDAFFKPTQHYHLYNELKQAMDAEKRSSMEAARLSKEVQMAEHARKWLANRDENTKMPLSLEEKDWEHACGGRNLVAPAWIPITRSQVDALVRARERHTHPIALFPDAVAKRAQFKLKVKLISAQGLRSENLGNRPSTYCTCEIPMKKDSRLQTAVVPGDPNPKWGHSRSVKGYARGDAIFMEVYGVFEQAHERQPGTRAKMDELLGRAFLPGDKFYPNGFDGLLNLTLGTRQTGATLHVIALIVEDV
eukprot:TRINITY_DN4944_c1_g2_i1.p1 TRINITY_DN4944_c1_g2~~TRINITY_DN4944_c1_g2_i1.p1  ORF type:complete len:1994 (-),score=345.92 TRINITY_DN4944_c1_g2_i1:416-6397(-)